jgi:hypothetical protein
MDTFDSQGRVSPIGAADQGIVSKKVADKEGQGQGFQPQHQKKVAPVPIPEEDDEGTQTEDHVIDIIV